MFAASHLSKAPSDLKQKCTQFLTPFSGTVFNALSLGVIHFVRSVSLRNRFLVGWNSSTANQKTSISRFVKLTLQSKWITPCERASKTVPENGVGNCVHLCLWPLEPLERCAFSLCKKLMTNHKPELFYVSGRFCRGHWEKLWETKKRSLVCTAFVSIDDRDHIHIICILSLLDFFLPIACLPNYSTIHHKLINIFIALMP